MPKKPLVSIITVTYNIEDTIRRTIESVLAQSYPEYEYIIVDGRSTDNTVAIEKEYQEKLAFFVSEPDKGLYDAINKGIVHAQGEWVYCLQGDDIFANNDSLAQVAAYLKKTTADVVYGDATMKLDYGVISSRNGQPIETMWKTLPFSHQAMFVRTNIAKNYLYDTQYRLAADYDFAYKLYKAGHIFQHIPVTVAVFSGGGRSDKQRIKGLQEVFRIKQSYDTNKVHLLLHRLHLAKTALRLRLRNLLPEAWVAAYFRRREWNKWKTQIIMLGPGETGGIGQYIRDVSAHYDRPNMRVLYTHYKKQVFLVNVLVFCSVIVKLFSLVLASRVSKKIVILHIHLATKGSFVRKFLLLLLFRPFVRGVVLHLHGAETASFFDRLARYSWGKWAIERCMQLPNRIISVSKYSQTEVFQLLAHHQLKYDKEKLLVLHNAVALPENFSSPKSFDPANPLEIAMIARLEPQKNIFVLLDIARLLAKAGIDSHFRIIGSGTQQVQFERAIRDAHLTQQFTLYGMVPNKEIDSILQQCTLFILPSKAESFGIVVLEAYRNGLPVITSNVGGLNDIVREGVTGFVCNPDKPEEFAAKIIQLVKNPQLLKKMQGEVQQEVRKYGYPEHIKKLNEIYSSVAES